MFVRICRFCKHILPSKFYGWCYTFENHAITTHIWALVFHTWWKKMNLVFVHIIKHLPFLDFVLVQLVPNVNSCKNMCKREDKWAAFSWWPRIYSVVTVVVCWTLITFVMWRGGGGCIFCKQFFFFFCFYFVSYFILLTCVCVCDCMWLCVSYYCFMHFYWIVILFILFWLLVCLLGFMCVLNVVICGFMYSFLYVACS